MNSLFWCDADGMNKEVRDEFFQVERFFSPVVEPHSMGP